MKEKKEEEKERKKTSPVFGLNKKFDQFGSVCIVLNSKISFKHNFKILCAIEVLISSGKVVYLSIDIPCNISNVITRFVVNSGTTNGTRILGSSLRNS